MSKKPIVFKCEDSSRWKCNWTQCEGGAGLAGSGVCSSGGEWDNPDCPEFVMLRCQHNVRVYLRCTRCAESATAASE